MKRIGPLLTVVAVVVLGVVLFAVNSMGNPANRPTAEVGAAATSAAAAASAAPETAAPATTAPPVVKQNAYAGRTTGKEMTIAVVVKDGKAVAYACDGKKVEAWLEGTLSGNTLALRTADDSATLTGTVGGGVAEGTIKIGSRAYPFRAPAVKSPAGLYLGRAVVKTIANKIGWIVLPDGTQIGIVKPANGEARPAPAFDPAQPGGVSIDGTPVTVTAVDGSGTVTG